MNKITRKDYPTTFNDFIFEFLETSYDALKMNRIRYRKSIVDLTEKRFPEFPELWGYWETNQYIYDPQDPISSQITELNRVIQVEETITVKTWKLVK